MGEIAARVECFVREDDRVAADHIHLVPLRRFEHLFRKHWVEEVVGIKPCDEVASGFVLPPLARTAVAAVGLMDMADPAVEFGIAVGDLAAGICGAIGDDEDFYRLVRLPKAGFDGYGKPAFHIVCRNGNGQGFHAAQILVEV